MATIDNLRSGIIDKIITIRNKEFLEILDKLISLNFSKSEIKELNIDQKTMLEMSKEDIKNGRLISQEAMDKRNLEWLNSK